MRSASPLISIIDDDASVREALPDLLHELGYVSQAFPSAKAFLSSGAVDNTCCLILDVAMPEMTGPELHRELILRRRTIPVIFITAIGDEALRPRLLAAGAVDCLSKPVSEQALIEAIEEALRSNGPQAQCASNKRG
jgi:FixJ family two-component response regulator